MMDYYDFGLSTRAISASVTQLYQGATAGRGDLVSQEPIHVEDDQ
ncbi:hypothetical protein AVEN_73769-1, partial [Araneus ventricosus]